MLKHRLVTFLLWLAFIIAGLVIAYRADYRADITAFLPATPTADQQILVDQLKDGAISRMVLIGIDAADAQAAAAISKSIAKVLRGDARFSLVGNGEPVGIEATGQFLTQYRYHLNDTQGRWSEAALTQSLLEARSQLAQSAGLFTKELLPRDPTGETLRMLDQLQQQYNTPQREGVWMVDQCAPSENPKPCYRALIIAQTAAAGIDLDAQQSAMQFIQAQFAVAQLADTGKQARLHLTGPGMFSAMSRDRIKRDATVYSTVATVLVVLLIFWVYRSPLMMTVGLMPVATGVIAGIAAVALSFGSVHGITMGFGATMIGEAVDYAVYLFTLHGQRDKKEHTAKDTMRLIWPTLRLGVVLSIVGFGAMLFADFPGLQQLGVFSAAGLIAAVLTARFVLPPLIPASFVIHRPPFAQVVVNAVIRAPQAVSRITVAIACGLVVVVLIAIAQQSKTQVLADNLTSLNPISQREQQLDEAMRNALGAPDVRFAIVVQLNGSQTNLEAALTHAERAAQALDTLQQQGVISGYQSPTQYLPSQATQRARLAALPDAASFTQAIAGASAKAGFDASLFAAASEDIRAVKQLSAQLTLLTLGTMNAALKDSPLAAQVNSLLSVNKQGITVMMPLQGATTDAQAARLKQAIATLQSPHTRLVDLKTESDALYQTYRTQAVSFALIGIAAITLILAVALRSLRHALRLMLPLVLSVALTAAALLALGVSISIFHIVAFLLVVGVGSNYALFFDQVSSEADVANSAGNSAVNSIGNSIGNITVALMVCALSTMFGFGVLAFSSMPVLQAIGGTVAAGAMLSLLLSAVLVRR
jgi:predicted exporter